MKLILVVSFLASFTSALFLPPTSHDEEFPQLIVNDHREIKLVKACWAILNCSFDDIRNWDPSRRLDFLEYMQYEHFGELGASGQFGDMEGTQQFTIRKGIAGPGTWISYVEAAATEAVERAAAIVLGYSNDTGSNPAVVRWINFFREQRTGRLSDRKRHDQLWSAASLAALDHGINQAEMANISKATAREQFWVQGLRVHRQLMQNRPLIVFFVRAALVFTNKSLAVTIERALDFFTQVTTPIPARMWSEVVWQVGGVLFGYHVNDGIKNPESLLRIAKQFWGAYEDFIKEKGMIT